MPSPPHLTGHTLGTSTRLYISGASEAVASGQVPSSHSQGPHVSTMWLTAGQGSRTNADPSNWTPVCFQVRDAASAADRAHGLLWGTGHLQGPAGGVLLASHLLGRAPGGSGGIGPDGDVIPASLKGESHITGEAGGSRGRGHPSRGLVLKGPRGTLPGPTPCQVAACGARARTV